MPDTTPLVHKIQVGVANAAAGSDLETPIGEAPWAGTVTRVAYISKTAITGANTDSRTVQLFNRAQDGTGTAKAAELALVSAVNTAAEDAKEITPITAASANAVAAGDVLAWKSLHVGSTGLADPGGEVIVEITRS